MVNNPYRIAVFICIFFLDCCLQVKAQTSGALSLLEIPSARAAAMGEAVSTIGNEISAMPYNPASLSSLHKGQASFSYQRGLNEDTFGQALIGVPHSTFAYGISVGVYDGGSMKVFDGTKSDNVSAQRDLMISATMAKKINHMRVGISAKSINSELAQTDKAHALALDSGVLFQPQSRWTLGLSLLNIGNKLTYVHSGDSLPRQLRGGVGYQLPLPAGHRITATADLPYYMVDKKVKPALGIDVGLGILSLRAGYQTDRDLGNFSLGTGFLLGSTSLDYSFSLVNDLNSRHQISFSFQFGPSVTKEPVVIFPLTEKIESPQLPADEKSTSKRPTLGSLTPAKKTRSSDIKEEAQARRVYRVQPGDTLRIIAKKYYGNSLLWKKIYVANQHLISQPEKIEVGQKIIIP